MQPQGTQSRANRRLNTGGIIMILSKRIDRTEMRSRRLTGATAAAAVICAYITRIRRGENAPRNENKYNNNNDKDRM